MKITNHDSPIFIVILCIYSIIINIISSIYFFPILFIGILCLLFFLCIKQEYYYSLFFVIITFLFIELNNGFKPFSLSLLAGFTYFFVKPYIKRVLSFETSTPYIYMAVFYLGTFILWSLNNEISAQLNYVLLINLIIDFLIFGVFI
jgi:hypothetical protein